MRLRSTLWMRLLAVLCVFIGLLQLSACHKTVAVFGPSALPNALAPGATEDMKRKAALKKLPGIPFYNHYGVCTQETVWLEPQTTLTLTVTPEGGKPVTQTMTLNNHAFHDPDSDPNLNAGDFVSNLNALQGEHEITGADSPYCPSVAAVRWQDIEKKYRVTAIDETADSIQSAQAHGNLVPVSNTAEIGAAVDYTRIFYLNAQSPVNGTSSVDAKLNADGTLGEGSASRDDETLSTLLTTLSTLGSGGLSAWSTVRAASIAGQATVSAAALAPAVPGQMRVEPHCDPGGGWPGVPPKKKVTYTFIVTPGGFTHDHKLMTPLETLDKTGGRCEARGLVYSGNFTVSAVGGEDKADKNAITVNGTVTLPKAKAVKP